MWQNLGQNRIKQGKEDKNILNFEPKQRKLR